MRTWRSRPRSRRRRLLFGRRLVAIARIRSEQASESQQQTARGASECRASTGDRRSNSQPARVASSAARPTLKPPLSLLLPREAPFAKFSLCLEPLPWSCCAVDRLSERESKASMSLRTLASQLWARTSLTAVPTRAFASSACSCAASPPSANNSSPPSDSVTAPRATKAAPPARPRQDLARNDARYLASLVGSDLSAFDPVLDVHPDKANQHLPRTKHAHADASVTWFNDTPANRGYQQPRPPPEMLEGLPGEDDAVGHLAQLTDLSAGEIRNLYRFPLVVKRVVTMKSKGKQPSLYALVVVGNGRGLVGVGEGKDDAAPKAVQKAFNQAVRSMDYVDRYEDRTVWGTMRSNFGTCKVEMRSRPPGPLSQLPQDVAGLRVQCSRAYMITILHRLRSPSEPAHSPGRQGGRHHRPLGQGVRLAESRPSHQTRGRNAPWRLKPSRCVPSEQLSLRSPAFRSCVWWLFWNHH